MNYERIYNEFIADRKAKEPEVYRGLSYTQRARLGSMASGEYTEHHHIVPRAMGGDDYSDNIISLSARDHYFAHWVLANIYGGTQWAAFVLLSESAHGERRVKSRQYAKAAKESALARRDHKEYYFCHQDFGERVCTKHVLSEDFNVPIGMLHDLTSANTNALSANGWYLGDENPDGLIGPPDRDWET